MKNLLSLMLLVLHCSLISAQWNPNTSVNLEIASQNASDMESLPTSDGKTWIAFYSLDSATGNYDMRAQLLDKNGNKLLGNDGALVSNQPSGSAIFVFNICLDETENLIIACQDERTGSGLTAAVYKISQSGSSIWGTSGVELGEGIAPYPAELSNGEVIVAYNDYNTNTLSLQKITTSGTKAWFNPMQVWVGTSSTTRGQVVPNSNGNFTLVFQKRSFGINGTLYAQRYQANGTAIWNNPLQLNSEGTSTVKYYSVFAEGDTTYCGFSTSLGFRFNSWLQRINPDGTLPYGANGSNFSTATGGGDPYQLTTRVAAVPESPFVWSICSMTDPNQSLGGVHVQKFLKSTGARQLGNTGKIVFPITAHRDRQEGELSLLQDGPFFMVYADSSNFQKIFATRLDTAGNFFWQDTVVEMASTNNSKGRFGFGGWNDRQAVAVWNELRGGLNEKGYAQNITPGGLFGIKVMTEGGIPAVTDSITGVLQLRSLIYPSTADQSATWMATPAGGSGAALVNDTGLVTGTSAGLVWIKAIAVQDNSVMDSLLVLIRPYIIHADSLKVVTASGRMPVLKGINDTLRLKAIVWPSTATDKRVDWSIIPISGNADIDSNGWVKARAIGSVWARAILKSNTDIRDSILIDIQSVDTAVQEIRVIYPNPSGGMLKIYSSQPHPSFSLTLFDDAGRKLAELPLQANALQDTYEEDFSRLPAGIYFFRSSDEKALKSFRWLKH